MYNVIGIGTATAGLYFISYILCRINLLSRQSHLRLWNFILAAAFTLTALAGVFLALQINYKWNIPVIKTILRWHVEMGIGMTVTGFLHFFRHFSYFTQKPANGESHPYRATDKTAGAGWDISINLFIVGFISSSVQLLLLREMMNITGGYELISGVFLCSWLIGSAAGSALAPKSPLTDIRKINLLFSTAPVISVALMLTLSVFFLKPGETPSFLTGMVFTFLVLLPFCLISGFTFMKLVSAGQYRNIVPGNSFSVETAGGIVSGIVISLLSAGVLNTYKSLLLIVTLGIAYMVLTFFIDNKNQKLAFKSTVLVLSALLIIFQPDMILRQFLLRGITVTETSDTPYGNVTKGEYQNETSIYYNQRLIAYNNDAVESEEDIHYAMLQTDDPGNVLLISGPVDSRIKELSKYNVTSVVYAERDPALSLMATPVKPEASSVLVILNIDALSFIRKTEAKFDAVIMLLPPPSSLLLNRYYTFEFFTEVRSKMNPGGVFSCSPGINPNYFNKESIRLYSSVFNSLKAVFKNVVPVSGNKLYFISSDKELSTAFSELAVRKNISNLYVCHDYLSDDLTALKSDEVASLMDNRIKINRSVFPVACFYYQSFSLSKNMNEKIPGIVLLVLLFALSLKSFKSNNSIMYFSALALAGYEIILLLMLQVSIGNMYQVTGLIIAGLMAGLAAGSGIRMQLFERVPVAAKAALLILFYAGMGLAARKIIEIDGHFAVTIILILSGFLPAVVTGSFFRDLTSGRTGNSDPARVYSADLSGSAIGFISFSGLAVPLLGMSASLFTLPLLILAGFLFSLAGKKH